MEITLFRNVRETKNPIHIDIQTFFDKIKKPDEYVTNIIKDIRQNKLERKIQLPLVCFSGKFSERCSQGLIGNHSGIICVDLDDLSDTQLKKEHLKQDPYVFCTFISPSGKGLKVLFLVEKTLDTKYNHLSYYEAINQYLIKKYNCYADFQCRDLARGCFLSEDENIYINQDSEIWTEKVEVKILDNNSNNKEIGQEYFLLKGDAHLEAVRKIASKYNLTNIGNRNSNLCSCIYLYACADIPKDVCQDDIINIMGYYIKSKANEKELKAIIDSGYDSVSNKGLQGTWKFEDKKKKERAINYFNNEMQLLTRKEQVLFIKENFNIQDLDAFISYVKRKQIDFLNINPKGQLSFNPHKFKWFLLGLNIYCKDNGMEKQSELITINNSIISYISKDKVRQIINDYILSLDIDSYEKESYFNYFNSIPKFNTLENYKLANYINIDDDILTDNETESYMPFAEYIYKIDKDNIKEMTLLEMGKYIHKSELLGKENNIKRLNYSEKKGQFETFIELISGDYFENICSYLGYLLHGYKNHSQTIAPIFTESKAVIFKEARLQEGGTGKSLIMNALSYMKSQNEIDCRNFAIGRFAFSGIVDRNKLLALNDIKNNDILDAMFNMITGTFVTEKKGLNERLILTYDKSPKIYASTNFYHKFKDVSYKRRYHYFIIKNFFNDKKKPIDVFKNDFFYGWKGELEQEWHYFYSFMFRCIKIFLKKGLIPQDDNKYLVAVRNEYPEVYKFLKEIEFEYNIGSPNDYLFNLFQQKRVSNINKDFFNKLIDGIRESYT